MSSIVGETGVRHMRRASIFDQFLAEVRAQVDSRLAWWLEARVTQARARGTEISAVADAVRQLVLRGGKRMRATLLAAAYEGCQGEGGIQAVAPALASLELLQAYLLAHDDWMDGDEVRRGGPSVPAMMRAHFGKKQADAASVLAGDLAAGWALQSMLELALAPARIIAAVRELGRVEEEVVHGQILDVCAGALDVHDVEKVYALKTASYTVRSPIVIGAVLAGADETQVAALAAFAGPLGIAFQLRDDMLGMFGDAHAMGKPLGGDLREGKRTALVIDAMRDPGAAELLSHVLGRADASAEEIAAAIASLETSGARARIEQRIKTLVSESRAALDGANLTVYGLTLLTQAVVVLTERDR
ncbi:MAG: polyprenyl synthetase family protein [Myxococcota bacterium]|nr:polyprenyl synthetase family protein [Myxococcota bacterium]